MQLNDIIGMSITNIFSIVKIEVGGLDNVTCYLELDNSIVIEIPHDLESTISEIILEKSAINLFADLSDYPIYHVNKNNKKVGEIAASYQKKSKNIYYRLLKFLFQKDIILKDYQPYKITYQENKLKHIKDRKIIDILHDANDFEKCFLLLDNGYLISEINYAPHGTGHAGLIVYDNIHELICARGNDFISFNNKIN